MVAEVLLSFGAEALLPPMLAARMPAVKCLRSIGFMVIGCRQGQRS